MSDKPYDDPRPRLRNRPWTLLFVIVVIGLPVLYCLWIAWAIVSGGLEMRSAANQAKDGLTSNNSDDLTAGATGINSGMGKINRAVSSLPLRAAGKLPWIGTSIEDAQLMTQAGYTMTQAGIPVAQSMTGGIYSGRTINLAALDSLMKALPATVPAFDSAISDVSQVQGTGPLGGIFGDLRNTALPYLTLGKGGAETLAPRRQLMLDSLGAKTTKNYLVVFENNAVLTAPGGLPLTAAIVSFDKGKIGIPFNGYIGLDAFDGHKLIPFTPVSPPLGGSDDVKSEEIFIHAGSHPDWRFAGEDTMRAWNAVKTPKVDSAVGIDTRAMQAVIAATGPVDVPGYGTLNADNFVEKLLADAYTDYKGNVRERQSLNKLASQAVVERLLSGDLQTMASVGVALSLQSPGRHLQMKFADSQLQQITENAMAAGAIHMTPGNDTVGFFSRNANASKVDIYSKRSMVANVNVASDGSANVEQVLTVTNDSPADLDSNVQRGYVTAWSRNIWYLYVPIGATEPQLVTPEQYSAPKFVPDGLGRTLGTTTGRIAPRATIVLRLTYKIPAGTFTGSGGGIEYRTQLNPQPIQPDVDLEVNLRAPDGMSCKGNQGWSATGDGATWRGEQAARQTLTATCK